LSHPSRKTSHFGPVGKKLFLTGQNVTIRLGLKHVSDSSLISKAWSGKATWARGRSYLDFFPASRLRFGWVCCFVLLVTSHLSLFSVTKMWHVIFVTCLGRMWRSRTRKYFFQSVTFFVTSFPKNITFWPRLYKKNLNGKKCDYSAATETCFSSSLRFVTYLGSVKREGHLG